ncbi:hypothetical protein CYMTET_38118 [Cymbomonas tetramitiformis]|uniref:Uncharacterized protein n=1 Tax=Cymbomonas tetramitiformis TaxID=36881 RepID=A0AAE0CEQ1_9CHLO|nr:hypothetical protein CYMTET_38118 [Cymbomonas tetramitiformis]
MSATERSAEAGKVDGREHACAPGSVPNIRRAAPPTSIAEDDLGRTFLFAGGDGGGDEGRSEIWDLRRVREESEEAAAAAAAAETESAVATALLEAECEMADTYETSSSSSWKRFLTSYTGAKDEDRSEFIQNLARAVEELRRTHEASVRAKLKSFTGQALSADKRAWIRNSWPDYQAIWDVLPTLMQGKDGILTTTVAFSWLMEAYEKDGVVASNTWRILKNMEGHGPVKGSIPCGKPPFHERAPGSTWTVAKAYQDGDHDGEESEEYKTEGTSIKGLTGPDGKEESMYFWALRLFVAELDAKFMLKGDKEKKDLLTSRVQLPGEPYGLFACPSVWNIIWTSTEQQAGHKKV